MAEWITEVLSEHGLVILYAGTFVILVVCGLGLPIPEEATFLAAGYAASQVAGAHLGYLCLVGVLGILAGDSIPFLVGKYHGRDFLQHRFLARVLTAARMARAQEFFGKHGSKTVFCARFVAGLRMPTFFMAASMGVKYRTFLFWDLMGALISCPTSIVVAYYFGPKAEALLRQGKLYAVAFAVGLVAAAIVVHFWLRKRQQEAAVREQTVAAPPCIKAETSGTPQAERAEIRQ